MSNDIQRNGIKRQESSIEVGIECRIAWNNGFWTKSYRMRKCKKFGLTSLVPAHGLDFFILQRIIVLNVKRHLRCS